MDFKNVQRRVYDALNVLEALKFIRKDDGKIVWQGIFASPETVKSKIEQKLREKELNNNV